MGTALHCWLWSIASAIDRVVMEFWSLPSSARVEAGKSLTLTKERAERGFFAWLPSCSGAPLGAESGADGTFRCREKM